MCERLVICNEEDTGGRARVTRDEERVLSCRLNRDDIVWVVRLAGCKNFVGEREEFIFNAFIRGYGDTSSL